MQLYDENGNTVEAKTQEEVTKDLEEKTKSLEEATTKLAALEAKAKELESEVNPNWRKLREEHDKLQKFVKDKGIKQEDEKFSREEIVKEAQQTAERTIVNSHKSRLLAQYDEKTRSVVERYFDKLSSGEQLTIDNVETYLSEAERLAVPSNANGRPPAAPEENKNFADTEQGKSFSEKMGLS
jgi:myosin heavy subunit